MRFGLSQQDALVLASVRQHLAETEPVRSCFLNRNSNDFEDPGILDDLETLGCRFFSRFGAGLGYIQATLPS